MGVPLRGIFLLCLVKLAASSEPACTIDFECAECVPDNMPLVTSHRASGGQVSAAHGDEVLLSCGGGGKFVAYPLLGALAAACEAGRLRVRHDNALRHLLELGCQENVFEDVQHSVEHCGSPSQGRAYQVQESARSVRHLATLCFDADRALTLRAHASNAPRNQLPMPAHDDNRSPLSLLGNFNHMFDARTRHDAEKLYSDDVRLNKRLHELLKHDRYSFARQTLTAGKLLSSHYFDDQNMRVTDFVSNKLAVWGSVAEGNLHHLHMDVAKLMKLSRPHATLDVYAGTHGVMGLRTGHAKTEVYLKPGNRFPVPKYIWTVVHNKRDRKGLALVLLNDPFVAVSEIREAVFCDSACGRAAWLHELRRNRNYESAVYGLVFCCSLQNFTNVVPELPQNIIRDVLPGSEAACTIDFECAECVPDNMPLVTSHRASGGQVSAAHGDEVLLSCGGGGKFVAYPLLGALAAACEAGRLRVRHDNALRHLLELGCQENVFEDVQHSVEHCGSPSQGRAYQVQESARSVRHLATLCFDADRALTLRAHASNAPRNQLPMPAHDDNRSPLSLLGNFNHMFDARTRHDAEKLYSDDVRLNKRLHELLKHDRYSFARQTLTAGKLLSSHYFDDQNMRVTDFVSNKLAVWGSVAEGNLHHLHMDVAKLMKLSRPHATLDVYAGTHGVMGLRTGHAKTEVYLKPGNRFPVPKYIWTVVHNKRDRKGLALVLLNDPFVAVSEIREAVFCDSACGRAAWLHELRRNRNYESAVYGLVFCCSLQNFTNVVPELPQNIIRDVLPGSEGILLESFI